PSSIVSIQRNPQRPESAGGPNATREVVAGTGAPVREALTSYAEQVTAVGVGPTRAVYSAPTRTVAVEYPEGIGAAPILELGFDGRDAFEDRARGALPGAAALPAVVPDAPTDGAAQFGPGATPLTYPSPHFVSGTASTQITAVTVEAWVAHAGAGARTVLDQPGAYRLQITAAHKIAFTAGNTTVETD